MGKLLNAFGLGLAITLMLLAQLLLSPHYRDPRLRAGAPRMPECQDGSPPPCVTADTRPVVEPGLRAEVAAIVGALTGRGAPAHPAALATDEAAARAEAAKKPEETKDPEDDPRVRGEGKDLVLGDDDAVKRGEKAERRHEFNPATDMSAILAARPETQAVQDLLAQVKGKSLPKPFTPPNDGPPRDRRTEKRVNGSQSLPAGILARDVRAELAVIRDLGGMQLREPADAGRAMQRDWLARFGGAPGLTRAEQNAMDNTKLDRYLAGYQSARAKAGKGARLRFENDQKHPCRQPGAGGRRVFAHSDRKDFNGFIFEELLELGLCPVSAVDAAAERNGTAPIDFYMGSQFESPDGPRDYWAHHHSKAFSPEASVGAMPGLMDLFGTKRSYATFYWRCRALEHKKKNLGALCPAAWLLSWNVNGNEDPTSKAFQRNQISAKDIEHLEETYTKLRWMREKNKFPLVFIVKPQEFTYLSRGMHLARMNTKHVNSRGAFHRWIDESDLDKTCGGPSKKFNPKDTRCNKRRKSFQQYVMDTMVVHGRKFDVRMWVLIANLDPLRVYLLRHGYPKIAAKAFDGFAHIHSQCTHIRLMLDPACNVSARDFIAPFPDGYPKSTASPVFFEGFQGASGHSDWVDAEDWWQGTVWPDIEEALAKVMMVGRSSFLTERKAAHAASQTRNKRRKGPDLSYHRSTDNYRNYALISPDIAVSRSGRAYIEEINTNGMILGTNERGGGYRDLFHDDDYIRAMLQILGADAYPESKDYAPALKAAVNAFCAHYRGRCSARLRRELELAVHEEAHAGPAWYRIYPPLPCHSSRHGRACRQDADGSWWPDQGRIQDKMHRAMGESELDAALRAFLNNVDTENIHGVPQVPGHGRWYPRRYMGRYAP